jgi:ATP-dependent RNA helicase DDX5/DBP2
LTNLVFSSILIFSFTHSLVTPNYLQTGRAGKKGDAVSFFVSEKNGRLAKELVEILNRTTQVVPPELQAMSSFSRPGKGRGGGGRGGFGGRGGRY